MKKFTKLKIFILMSLAIGSINIHADEKSDKEAITNQVDSAQNLNETVDILEELEISNPEVIKQIILDENDLDANFGSVKSFTQKFNSKIEKYLQKPVVSEIEITKLAVELADTQAAFEKASARYNMKYKKEYKGEQAIKDNLMKAAQGLQSLSLQLKNGLEVAYTSTQKAVKKANQTLSKGIEKSRQYLENKIVENSNYMTDADQQTLEM